MIGAGRWRLGRGESMPTVADWGAGGGRIAKQKRLAYIGWFRFDMQAADLPGAPTMTRTWANQD